MKAKKRIVTTLQVKAKKSPLLVKKNYHHYLSRSRGTVHVEKHRVYAIARMSGTLGETLEQLAKRLDVPKHVLGRWMMNDKRIGKSIQRGIDAMLVQVEMAMVKRAKGYDVPVREVTTRRDITGHVVEKTVRHSSQHIPGDPSTMRFLSSKRLQKRYPADSQPEGTKIIINMDKDDEGL